MRILGENKTRHWHRWTPNDKRTQTVKVCECGATKYWAGTQWRIKYPTKAKKN